MDARGITEFALVQHPMILLIHKDRGEPAVGERVAPWGAPDMKEYAQRVRRNLQALREYSDLCLNYEFSAVELEILAQVAPDVLAPMREMVAQKRLAFVGGDYSQPHGQLFSGELNFRQLEHGLRIFRELVGYTVTNNYHQETCLHDQMPQLLKAFGFRTAAAPNFAHTITPLPGEGGPSTVAAAYRPYTPIAADALATWRGLDGTELPVFVAGVNMSGFREDFVRHEEHRGLWRSSELVINAPDMEEISREQYEFMKSRGPTVLLDEAIERRLQTQQPTWKARLHTYWSYSEGEWAEEMYRRTRETEVALWAEEAHAAVRGISLREDFDADVKTVLASMHHDVHWIEVTDLKRQYLREMEKVRERSRAALARHVGASAAAPAAGQGIRVVNHLPYGRREVAQFHIPAATPVRVVSADGKPCPTQCVPSASGEGLDVLFLAEVPPLGMADYRLVPYAATLSPGQPCDCAEVHVKGGRYRIAPNGTVLEAWDDLRSTSRNLLTGPGHDLQYLDTAGNIVGGPSRPGKMVRFHGEVGDVLRCDAPVGDVPTTIEILASEFSDFLQITTTFDFNDHSIGVMWQDWTKLNCYWAVDGRTIRHDIPFGAVTGQERVPLYATSWLSVSGSHGGLAVLNAGTPKHFVEDGRIGCVWAWGGRTFSNRMHVEWANKTKYDLTLKGRHSIRSAVMATAPMTEPPGTPFARHPSTFLEGHTSQIAQCFNNPLTVFAASGGPAAQSAPLNFLEAPPGRGGDLGGTGLIATAVMREGNALRIRFFEAEGREHSLSDLKFSIGRHTIVTDLEGRQLETVPPYRIGYLLLT